MGSYPFIALIERGIEKFARPVYEVVLAAVEITWERRGSDQKERAVFDFNPSQAS